MHRPVHPAPVSRTGQQHITEGSSTPVLCPGRRLNHAAELEPEAHLVDRVLHGGLDQTHHVHHSAFHVVQRDEQAVERSSQLAPALTGDAGATAEIGDALLHHQTGGEAAVIKGRHSPLDPVIQLGDC